MYYCIGNLHTNVHRSISSLIVGHFSILWMKNSENIRKQIFRDNYLGYSILFFTLFDNVGYSVLYPEKKNWCYFQRSVFVHSVLFSVVSPIPHCLGYCSFIININIAQYKSFNYLLLLQYCVAYSSSLSLHVNFRVSC